MSEQPRRRPDTSARIVEAAARLLREHGPTAVTTRAVADAAGVQAPAIYRAFGDKDGLLEAVAEHVLAGQVAAKAATVEAARAEDADPVEELRAGWRSQIEFGLANPALFRMLSDPDRALRSPAARAGRDVLAARVRRIAEAGRLQVPEQRAVDLVQAAGVGTVTTLLATAPERRDPTLAEAMLDAVLREVLVGRPAPTRPGPASAAVALRAQAHALDVLSAAERALLAEWLERVAHAR
ncbi:TetR/AcrR family transcriptional regulator [Motilibacter aurantiacus]|uniref:TetR/AcrR family transcriptional regulator n=1 Tax=Motilibacter aurantiacus TaxID=2714955 RepID=UPI0014099A6D|nr:TetR/AcrR family transcriptional regulator [Motilibacter aurantiacus]